MANPLSSLPQFPSPLPAPPPPEAGKTGELWYVGAIINVVGSVSINLGMNLMKLGHTKRSQLEMPEDVKPPIRKFKSWLFGIIIFITGNILNFVSFAFAAQSLLAALGSLQLVCNVFFAYFVNHEPVTKMIIVSTTCIIGGCVLLVVFGNQSSETYTVEQLIKFYTYPVYVVYLVMMGVFVFGFYVLYLHSKKVIRKRGEAGLWYGIMLVSYAIFSALLGTQSVLFGKSISVILRTTFTQSNQLRNWYTWVVLPIFAFTALFWVARLNKGLRMFPAMIIVPLLQIAWTLFSIVSGMLYFQEYKGFNTIKAIMFPVGVLIVFLGVFLLTVCGGGRSGAAGEADPSSEEAEVASKGGVVYDNAVFNARPDMDGHGPEAGGAGAGAQQHPAKMSLGQTLRFMSTWAPPSVALSPGGSHLNRTLAANESLRRNRRGIGGAAPDLNASGFTNRTIDELSPAPSTAATGTGTPTAHGDQHPPGASSSGWGLRSLEQQHHHPNSTLNRTTQSGTSRISESSMVSTMRRGLKGVGSRLNADMGLDVGSGLRLAVGLGDSSLAGVSLFAMPALDFTATARQRKSEHRLGRMGGGAGTGPRASETSILSSLPRSRFYKADPEGLTVIRETSGVPGTTVPTSPEMGASLTASSQLAPTPGGSQGGAAAASSLRAASSSSPDTGSNTPGRHQQHHQQRAASPSPGLSPSKPLTEAAMLSLLPVPSFQNVRQQPPADPGTRSAEPAGMPAAASPRRQGTAAAAATPAAGAAAEGAPVGDSGHHTRGSRRPSSVPDAALPPPGFRTPPPGPGGGPGGGGAMQQSGYDSDAYPAMALPLAQQRSGSVLTGGPSVAASLDVGIGYGIGGPAGHVPRGGGDRSSLPKPGSLGALLPEGVPLSTAPSVVLHESAPSTPPEAVMMTMMAAMQQQADRWAGAAGAGGYGPAAGGRGGGSTPGPRPQSATPAQRLHKASSQPISLTQRFSLQQHLSLQQQQQHIPLSLLQRATAPALFGTGRLPAQHLMVPGLPVSPSQLPQPPAGAMAGSGYPQYGSVSYMQLLAAQGFADTALAGSVSLGVSGGGALAPTAVRVQGRPTSPYGGLSVSRSWAGLSGMSGGGAAGATRQSPLRGSILSQMQRPLRPWPS